MKRIVHTSAIIAGVLLSFFLLVDASSGTRLELTRKRDSLPYKLAAVWVLVGPMIYFSRPSLTKSKDSGKQDGLGAIKENL